jgi:ABC-type taurine transport system substrate-binding protein
MRAESLGGAMRYTVSAEGALGAATVDAWRADEEFAEGAPVVLAADPAESVLYLRKRGSP